MIEIRYKCARCMKEEGSVKIEHRSDAQDVVEWLEEVVTPAVAADHRRRSPGCMATQLEYVKIPAPENAPYVGGKPREDS